MNAQVMMGSMTKDKHVSPGKDTDAPVVQVSTAPGSLFFVLLLVVLCALSGWRLLDPATLPIKHVRIEGNFQYLSPEKMQTLVTDVIRGGFFNLNVSTIKEALLAEPWVYWVVVQRVWPDGLRVNVIEQQATAYWNETDLLNESAQIFTPEAAVSIVDLPWLSGPAETQKLVMTRYGEMQAALTPLAIRVGKVSLSERRAWRIQLQDGPLVILGRNDIESRIDRFTESVVASLSDEISKIKQIDMRYTNGFAIQWTSNIPQLIESGLENNG